MLRGNSPATVDEKGRIKIPKEFRDFLLERFGDQFFVTSLDGVSVLIYPLSEWVQIEEKLNTAPRWDPSKKKVRERVNYFGKLAKIDNQGRVLIHPLLRDSAQINGEVAVIGNSTYLQVWNDKLFQERLEGDPLSHSDFESLSDFGI